MTSLLLVTSLLLAPAMAATRPHILMIVVDDLGWMDVGWRDPDMHTPTLDRFVSEGVNLTNHYVQPLCSPSRAAFMTGKYPFKMGMQDTVLKATYDASLPLGLTTLPEHLQTLNYATHMVGKWHLGFCNLDMTPTYRGFDSFYGMYLGKGDYYDHTGFLNGYDLWDNATAEWSAAGTYSTHLFTDRVLDILQAHDPAAKPIFIYLAYQAVHGPLEVPEYYETQFCSHVSDPSRKTHCAMTAAVDEGIANITDALENLGYTDNLLTVFTTDNGGPVTLGSSNWPLRGGKSTLWEGGTRAVSFLHSDTLLNGPYTWDGLMHAVDWYPTLVRAAGDKTTISGIDGVNQWNRIKRNGNSVRSEFVYNINEVKNTSAIRVNQWKLIYNKPGEPDGWHNPPTGVTAPADPSGPYDTYMLFDIDNDPEEMYDVKSSNPTVLSDMQAKLAAYEAELVSAETGNFVEGSKPQYWGGTWSTGWC